MNSSAKKLLSASAALAIALLCAAAAFAADVTGTWSGQMTGPGGNGDFQLSFTFKQDGAKLTGTVQGPQGDPIEITDGKVEGDKLSFTVKIDANGNSMKILHDGTISGDEIKLSSKAEGGEFPAGAITLKKVK